MSDDDAGSTTSDPIEGPTITVHECFKHFERFLAKERTELKVFYDGAKAIGELATLAKPMVESLFKLDCTKEIALQLSTLIMYDMVMLIGLEQWSWSHVLRIFG